MVPLSSLAAAHPLLGAFTGASNSLSPRFYERRAHERPSPPVRPHTPFVNAPPSSAHVRPASRTHLRPLFTRRPLLTFRSCPVRVRPDPIFWVVLQKMALVFDMVPGVLGGLHGSITARRPENRPEPNPLVHKSRHYRLPNRPELGAEQTEGVMTGRTGGGCAFAPQLPPKPPEPRTSENGIRGHLSMTRRGRAFPPL